MASTIPKQEFPLLERMVLKTSGSCVALSKREERREKRREGTLTKWKYLMTCVALNGDKFENTPIDHIGWLIVKLPPQLMHRLLERP